MQVTEIILLIENLLKLGMTAAEISQRVCGEYGGYKLPTIEEFDAKTRDLEAKPDL